MTNQPIELDDAIMVASLTKSKSQEISSRIVNAVEQGVQNPLDVYSRLKFAEQTIKSCLDGVKPFAIDEVNKYAKGEKIVHLGAELKQKEVGVKYDYSVCNHPRYNQLAAELAELKESITSLESMLKTVKEPYTLVDENTGETFKIYPPLKTSTSSIEVSIK